MSRPDERGFTLLELLVATVIMGVAVAGLLSSLESTLHGSARARQAEDIPIAAQQVMDRLLAEPSLPNFQEFTGSANEGISWVARVDPFEYPPHPQAGTLALQRIHLRMRWLVDEKRHTYELEGFRQSQLSAADALRLSVAP